MHRAFMAVVVVVEVVTSPPTTSSVEYNAIQTASTLPQDDTQVIVGKLSNGTSGARISNIATSSLNGNRTVVCECVVELG